MGKPGSGQGREPETVVARLSVAMLSLAAAMALGGGLWLLIQEGGKEVSFRTFIPQDPALTKPGAAAAAALGGRPAALVQLAVVLLLITPLARELALLILMARRREWFYALVASVVCLLLVSTLLASGLAW